MSSPKREFKCAERKTMQKSQICYNFNNINTGNRHRTKQQSHSLIEMPAPRSVILSNNRSLAKKLERVKLLNVQLEKIVVEKKREILELASALRHVKQACKRKTKEISALKGQINQFKAGFQRVLGEIKVVSHTLSGSRDSSNSSVSPGTSRVSGESDVDISSCFPVVNEVQEQTRTDVVRIKKRRKCMSPLDCLKEDKYSSIVEDLEELDVTPSETEPQISASEQESGQVTPEKRYQYHEDDDRASVESDFQANFPSPESELLSSGTEEIYRNPVCAFTADVGAVQIKNKPKVRDCNYQDEYRQKRARRQSAEISITSASVATERPQRRMSAPGYYKEPSLLKKLRRYD